VKDKGLYRLTTHNGLIAMPIAERANITLSARTYNGGIRSSFALPAPASPDQSSERRNKRVNLTLGNGSAHVELESFSGTIALRRPGEARPETERRRRDRDGDPDPKPEPLKDKPKIKGEIGRFPIVDVDVEPAIAEALAEVQSSMPEVMAEAQATIAAAVKEALEGLPMPHIAPMPTPVPMPKLAPAARPRRF
jgi:hypothetical protein